MANNILMMVLLYNLQKYQADINELEALGDLGHGTCGQVVKMAHKPTGHLMAVKVNKSLSWFMWTDNKIGLQTNMKCNGCRGKQEFVMVHVDR
jgi:hypothetical protein